MTVMFIHGVPDTPRMWEPLIAALDLAPDDYTAPALPGFGVPCPAGFAATKEAYVDWLISLLETVVPRSGPVDLVGHDWGALISLRVGHLQPDLLRSLTLFDGCLVPGFRWHSYARTWQRPVVGELSMLALTRSRMAQALTQWGLPPDLAREETRQMNWTMKRSILSLYRSAVDVGTQWGTDLSGLPDRTQVFWGETDPFGKPKYAARFCEQWNLPLHVEPGVGHWCFCERPEAFVKPLRDFWAR